MRLVFLDGGVLAQFEGDDRLSEFDWDRYRTRYGDIHRLDLSTSSGTGRAPSGTVASR